MSKRTINVEVDQSTGNLTYTDEEGKPAKEKHSKIKDKDTFRWCSDDGGLEIHFNKDGSPFYNDPNPTVNIGCTSPPLPVRQAQDAIGSFDYSVVLTDGAGQEHPDDPRIIIDPGGGTVFKKILTIALMVLLGLEVGLLGWRKFKSGGTSE